MGSLGQDQKPAATPSPWTPPTQTFSDLGWIGWWSGVQRLFAGVAVVEVVIVVEPAGDVVCDRPVGKSQQDEGRKQSRSPSLA